MLEQTAAIGMMDRLGGRMLAQTIAIGVEGLGALPLLGGGLPRGSLVEIVGRGSCGRFATLLAALRAVTSCGEAAALVDQGEQLDPQAAAASGIDLERLLWLRPRRLTDSLAAAEMLVHTGFPLVALDLGLPILTDDYSIQNLAEHMGIEHIAVGERGITRKVHWTYRCKGCGKYFDDKVEVCPICGSAVRSARRSKAR